MIYLLIITVTAGAVFAAYATNVQTTTKWLGRQIEAKKTIRTTPHSLATPLEIQTMISSPWVVARNFSMVAIYLAVGAVGFLIKWWVAVLALVVLIILGSIVSAVILPRKFSWWIKSVSVGVQNRIADYRKKNDFDRAESLSVFVPILTEYEELADSQSLDILKLK